MNDTTAPDMLKLLSRILGMHESKNNGLYNGEAVLSESVASEIRHTIAAAKKTPRPAPSRPARWADACDRAEAALSDLEELRVEYEEWRDNMPENLAESPLGEKLGEVADLDIQGALDTVQEAAAADLPRGFGKD